MKLTMYSRLPPNSHVLLSQPVNVGIVSMDHHMPPIAYDLNFSVCFEFWDYMC